MKKLFYLVIIFLTLGCKKDCSCFKITSIEVTLDYNEDGIEDYLILGKNRCGQDSVIEAGKYLTNPIVNPITPILAKSEYTVGQKICP